MPTCSRSVRSRGPSSAPPKSQGSRHPQLKRSPRCMPKARRRLIRCGWGLERNRNGGNAAMSVLALPAVGGKFGVRGGGYSMSNSASWNIDRTWIDAPEPKTRIVNMNHLGRALTRVRRPAGECAVRLQLQPGGDRPGSAPDHRGARTRGSVHHRVRSGDDGHGALRRPRAARYDVPRGLRLREGVRPDQSRSRPAGDRRRRRGATECRRVRRALRTPRRSEGERAIWRARPDGGGVRPAAARDRRAICGDGPMPAPPCGTAPDSVRRRLSRTRRIATVDLFPAALDASDADRASTATSPIRRPIGFRWR